MKKMWEIKADGRELDNGEIITTIFNNRGIEDIDHFLNPQEEDLIPFEKLHNIENAYNIISTGIDDNKLFLIYADCDVDGTTSGAIMSRYLYNYTNNIDITINQGKTHGVENYDVLTCNADIVIVVDSINENEHYQKFIDAGKQVIIFDHHIIPIDFRSDVVLVSSANNYDNPELSGAGVVWKFCKYFDYMTLNDYADELTDLACTGIIADMMNITSAENRYICAEGFKKTQNKGIKKTNGTYTFDSQAISFGIAPLINAANRLNLNKDALKLFISDDDNEIKEILKTLKKAKEEQNKIVTNLMPDIVKQANNQINNKVMFFIINTKVSISGLIGNKLIEIYNRPVFVLKKTKVGYAGSGRGFGIESLKILCDETNLVWTGGHDNAFGIEILKDNYEEFQNKINSLLKDTEFKTKTYADIQLNLSQITSELINSFKSINQISGNGFKPLTVMVDEITDYEVGSMSNGKHLKIIAEDITIIKWNFSGDFNEFNGRPLSVIGGLSSGFFGRKFTKQIIIDDWKLED